MSCTAHITPPSGQDAAYSVSPTQNVTVYVPGWTAVGVGGDLQVNNAKPVSDGIDYWLYAGPTNSPSESGGMDWHVTVTSPNPTLFGDGTPQIAQLITYGVSYTTRDANKVSTTYNFSLNGSQGLDGKYPQGWVQQPPQLPFYYAGDEPGFDVEAAGAYTAILNDSFEDFLMYLAPGSSQPVPLAHFTWSTNGTDTVPSAGWSHFGTGSAGSVTPSGSGSPFSAYNTFPKWTLVNNANAGSYVKAK